ncbi:hypothetical protein LguiA_023443 [Lonicera macranthoides]
MAFLTASAISSPAAILPLVRTEVQFERQIKYIGRAPSGIRPLFVQSLPFARRPISRSLRTKSASIICAAGLNARCAAGQTQTVTRESSTITIAPVQGKEKSPDLDDGGTGLPPRDDDGGGGGGGGGGGWSGGFFFFGFLAFLGFLKDNEGEDFNRDRER